MSPDSPADRYRRRHRTPILVVLAVLLVASAFAWTVILKPVAAASTSCNQPGPAPTATATSTAKASGNASASPATTAAKTTATTKSIITSLGSFASPNSLNGVRPADPAFITVQVFNASQTSGTAKTVTNDLRAAGFSSIQAGANDPLYPAFDLACTSEIRYGQAGSAAARTLLLIAPCAQLVMDNRISDTVNLSLGNRYTYAPLTSAVKTQLKAIHDAAIPPAVIEGQTAAPRPQPSIPPLPSGSCN